MANILIPVAPSELLDKLTILDIKLEQITDPEKQKNIQAEHELLSEVRAKHIPDSAELEALYQELKAANQEVWDVLDEWFAARKSGDETEMNRVSGLAQIYNNEKRFPAKRKIDELLKSEIVEEKSYLFDD